MWDYRKSELQFAKDRRFKTAKMPAGERNGYKGGVEVFWNDFIVE